MPESNGIIMYISLYITYIPFKNLIYVTSIIFTKFLRRISLYIATAAMVRRLAVVALLLLLACRSRSWVQRWPQQSRTLGCAPGLWGSLPRAPTRKEQNHQQRSRNPGNAWENHGKHDGIIAYSSCNMRDKCGKTMIIFAIFHAWLQSGHGAEH